VSSRNVKLQQKSNPGQVVQQATFYQGIIPSPEMMEQYKEVDPNLPNRLVQMKEEESQHRREMERRILNKSSFTEILGLILAFLVVCGIAVLAYFFMINGHPEDGKWIILSLTGLVAVFVTRKFWKNK